MSFVASPDDRSEQRGARLVVECDDDAGGGQVLTPLPLLASAVTRGHVRSGRRTLGHSESDEMGRARSLWANVHTRT